jgi:RNA 2',3'-cyclic 3'-phosphodiesterase
VRTFIAVEPPDVLRAAFGDFCNAISGYFPGLRWINPKNIHLTLRFLGEIDPADLGTLKEAVEKSAAGTAPFELALSKAGFFGSKRNPRVIWLGLEEQPLLKNLARDLEDSLHQAGFGRADKPFRGHLTLARIKRPLREPPDWEAINRQLPAAWPEWRVTRVQVIKSTLTPSGPIYEILKRCVLDG